MNPRLYVFMIDPFLDRPEVVFCVVTRQIRADSFCLVGRAEAMGIDSISSRYHGNLVRQGVTDSSMTQSGFASRKLDEVYHLPRHLDVRPFPSQIRVAARGETIILS